jgi:hypothetical protein
LSDASVLACRSCGGALLADGEGGWSCPVRDRHEHGRRGDAFPSARETLITELKAAEQELIAAVARQWHGGAAFKMSIPAQPDRDSDLIISGALAKAIEYLAALASHPQAIALQGYRCNNIHTCEREFFVAGNEEAYTCPFCRCISISALTGPFGLPSGGSPTPPAQEQKEQEKEVHPRMDTKAESVDSLTAPANMATPTEPETCANCGHREPHNGPAGDIADACTHPFCNCGYFVALQAEV